MPATIQQPLRLFLVRHGETAANLQMRYLGTGDPPLTENGIRQAKQAADALAQIPITIVLASPLRRAASTAAQIQAACQSELRLDSRLAEGSFGRWEGLSRDEVLGLDSHEAERLLRWESDPACAPPGGESIIQIQERVIDLINELIVEFPGSSIALVSHVGPIKALLAAVMDIPLMASRRLFLDPCTISVVDWGETPFLRLFNSHAHMGWPNARWMKNQ